MPARIFDDPPPLPEDMELAQAAHPGPSEQIDPFTAPPPGECPDDVVISGVSCRLPESDNMEEFRQNLILGKDMVTDDDRRWPAGKKYYVKANAH